MRTFFLRAQQIDSQSTSDRQCGQTSASSSIRSRQPPQRQLDDCIDPATIKIRAKTSATVHPTTVIATRPNKSGDMATRTPNACKPFPRPANSCFSNGVNCRGGGWDSSFLFIILPFWDLRLQIDSVESGSATAPRHVLYHRAHRLHSSNIAQNTPNNPPASAPEAVKGN